MSTLRNFSRVLWSLRVPLSLIAIMSLALLFGDDVPYAVKANLLSVSLAIKEVVVFVLPLIIFFLVFSSITNLEKGAFNLVALLICLVCISNFLSSAVAQGFGFAVLNSDLIKIATYTNTVAVNELHPTWVLTLNPVVSNSVALLLGFVLGLGVSLSDKAVLQDAIKKVSDRCLQASFFFLQRIFVPVMPIFILGFALKMQHDQMLSLIFNNYLAVFVLIIFLSYLYVFAMYGLATSFKIERWLDSISNMLPALVTSFSTMSSLVAMPFTLLGSEKNAEPNIANIVVPATVNIHLIGDSFAIMILVVSVVLSFGLDVSFHDYLYFMFYFTLSNFAVATVPGGGIIVVLPLLEQYLKFSPTMLSLMTVLYVIFDPFITSINVMGNGAFVMLVEKAYKLLFNDKKHGDTGS